MIEPMAVDLERDLHADYERISEHRLFGIVTEALSLFVLHNCGGWLRRAIAAEAEHDELLDRLHSTLIEAAGGPDTTPTDDEPVHLKSYCAYCGFMIAVLDHSDESLSLMHDHIRACDKHPMRRTEVACAQYQLERDVLLGYHVGAISKGQALHLLGGIDSLDLGNLLNATIAAARSRCQGLPLAPAASPPRVG